MTHKTKTYLIVAAVILAVVAVLLVLTGRADAQAPTSTTTKAGEICGPHAWKDAGGRWRQTRGEGSVWCSMPPGGLCSTTTTTGLVEEPVAELRRAPGTLRPCVTTTISSSTTTTTVTTPPGSLSPSTTICRIGDNGVGTYPNGEPCGAQPLRPVAVVAQPTYTG